MRKFEIIQEYKDKNINLPKRSTKYSAGYDIEAAADIVLPAFENFGLGTGLKTLEESKEFNKENNTTAVLVPTGLKIYCEEDEYISFVMRSSIASKNKIIMPNATGTIDSDYVDNEDNEGHCYIPLINLNPYPVSIKKGTKIAQAIFHKYLTVNDEDSENINNRKGGFGSTDTTGDLE